MPLSFHLRLLSVQFTCALLLSGAITLINRGYSDLFWSQWAQGFLVVFILLPFVVKLIPRLGAFLGKHLGRHLPLVIFKCVMAFCVAAMMETIIAFALTTYQLGWHAGFFGQWFYAVLMALPVGLVIGLSMVFYIQPRMQALIDEGQRIAAARKKGLD